MDENSKKYAIGTVYVLCTGLVLATYNALSKYLQTEGITVFQITFFSFAVSFLFCCFQGKPSFSLKIPYFSLYLYRTLSGVAAFYLLVLSTKFLPLIVATLLFNTSPIFVPYFAYFLLGQKLNHKLWIALAIGFGGVVLVLRPGADVFNAAALIGVAAGIASATTMVLVKKLVRVAEVPRILFYYFFIGTLLTAPPLIWAWSPLTLNTGLGLIGIGLLSYLFISLFTRGVAYIPATTASILMYIGIIFSALYDWWLWQHIPRLATVIGILLIILSGVLSILFERKLEVKK